MGKVSDQGSDMSRIERSSAWGLVGPDLYDSLHGVCKDFETDKLGCYNLKSSIFCAFGALS